MMTVPQSTTGSIREQHSSVNPTDLEPGGKAHFSAELKAYDTNGGPQHGNDCHKLPVWALFSEMGSIHHVIEKVPLC